MGTEWGQIGQEILVGSLKNIGLMAGIIIPLMIMLEAMRAYGTIEWLARRVTPVMHWLGMSGEAAVAVIVGLFFGIAYGAGVLIEEAESGRLTARDMILANTLLGLFHAMFEDSALFIATGADWRVIVVLRLLLALAVVFVLARLLVLYPRLENSLSAIPARVRK